MKSRLFILSTTELLHNQKLISPHSTLFFPQGDSGSPLVCGGIFRGITAFGLSGKCGARQGPGIYTSLSQKHLSWIKKTMKGAV